jgi:hypothetical protein
LEKLKTNMSIVRFSQSNIDLRFKKYGNFRTNVPFNPGVGYVVAGISTFTVPNVDKFFFSNDSRATIRSIDRDPREATGFASNTAGYVAGGVRGGTSVENYSTVTKFLFSNDSRSNLGTGLSVARHALAGFASDTAGYVAGGFVSVSSGGL